MLSTKDSAKWCNGIYNLGGLIDRDANKEHVFLVSMGFL